MRFGGSFFFVASLGPSAYLTPAGRGSRASTTRRARRIPPRSRPPSSCTGGGCSFRSAALPPVPARFESWQAALPLFGWPHKQRGVDGADPVAIGRGSVWSSPDKNFWPRGFQGCATLTASGFPAATGGEIKHLRFSSAKKRIRCEDHCEIHQFVIINVSVSFWPPYLMSFQQEEERTKGPAGIDAMHSCMQISFQGFMQISGMRRSRVRPSAVCTDRSFSPS